MPKTREDELPLVADMYELRQFLSQMIHIALRDRSKLAPKRASLLKRIDKFLANETSLTLNGSTYTYQDLLDLIMRETGGESA